MGLFLPLLLWAVGLFIMYLVIRAAIDHSEATKTLKEIKRLLSGKDPDPDNIYRLNDD